MPTGHPGSPQRRPRTLSTRWAADASEASYVVQPDLRWTTHPTEQRVRIDQTVLRKLDLTGSADVVTSGHLDRLPPLLLDRCLAEAKSKLVTSTVAAFTAGLAIHSETITMPRRTFGARPVSVISPSARLVYSALVGQIATELPEPSRRSANWKAFEAYSRPPADNSEYLVEFDIAACYEYIDHEMLRDELILRTMSTPHTEAIVGLLGEVFRRHRGLPQLIGASDSLADAYLAIMERELLRQNPRVARYADDFRITCESWAAANQTIEDAADSARAIGLILSSDKTFIWKLSTLREREKVKDAFLTRYFSEARDALTTIEYLWSSYEGVPDVDIVEPDEEVLVREALRQIFSDWFTAQAHATGDEDFSTHLQHLPAALGVLAKGGERLPDNWLVELVFRHPLRLEQVALYMKQRPETAANWATLALLSAMQRQSPWAKIWLLDVANDQLGALEGADGEQQVLDWAMGQLSDKHEIVRSEAAWHLARRKEISESSLGTLYGRASMLTRPALAAACGGLSLASTSGLARAVKQDGQLMAAAFEWGSTA